MIHIFSDSDSEEESDWERAIYKKNGERGFSQSASIKPTGKMNRLKSQELSFTKPPSETTSPVPSPKPVSKSENEKESKSSKKRKLKEEEQTENQEEEKSEKKNKKKKKSKKSKETKE